MAFAGKRLFSAFRLLATNPNAFRLRLREVTQTRRTRIRLSNLAAGQSLPIWVRYGNVEFPYYNDGDLQEIVYHTHFTRWYELLIQEFQPHISSGATVIDVGANIGLTTLVFSELAGSNGRVHSFEPAQFMHSKLTMLIEYNHRTNVSAYRQACGASPNRLQLRIPESSGNASLRLADAMQNMTLRVEEVEVLPLDDVLQAEPRIDLMKIDTEGFEIDVLKGAEAIIRKTRPTIYIELSAEYRASSEAAVQWLLSHDYVFPVQPDLSSSHNGDNFFALPSERQNGATGSLAN